MHRPREQSEDLLTEKRSPACEGEPRIRGSNACRFSQIFVHPPERQSRNCQSVNHLSSSKFWHRFAAALRMRANFHLICATQIPRKSLLQTTAPAEVPLPTR